MSNLAQQLRSILLSYVRAFLALFVVAITGALDPTQGSGRVSWSLGLAALWGAVPALLRAVEAALGTWNPTSLVARAGLSFARAAVATGLMSLVGPLEGAKPALRAFVIALGPMALRVLQELLDSTAPPTALARKGKTVLDVNGVQIT